MSTRFNSLNDVVPKGYGATLLIEQYLLGRLSITATPVSQ
jgi:hypothetical protein